MLQADRVPPELPLGKGRVAAHRTFPEALSAPDADITLPEPGVALSDAAGFQVRSASVGTILNKPDSLHGKSLWRPPDAARPAQDNDA